MARRARIVRPGFHGSDVNGPTVHDDGSVAEMDWPGITRRVSHARAAVDHYVVKSRTEFAAKIARGKGSRPLGSRDKYRRDVDEFWAIHDLNDEINGEALKRIANVVRGKDHRLAPAILADDHEHGLTPMASAQTKTPPRRAAFLIN